MALHSAVLLDATGVLNTDCYIVGADGQQYCSFFGTVTYEDSQIVVLNSSLNLSRSSVVSFQRCEICSDSSSEVFQDAEGELFEQEVHPLIYKVPRHEG